MISRIFQHFGKEILKKIHRYALKIIAKMFDELFYKTSTVFIVKNQSAIIVAKAARAICELANCFRSNARQNFNGHFIFIRFPFPMAFISRFKL